MKQNRLTIIAVGLVLAFAVSGCGPSKEERYAKERERLELEEKARRETEVGNKAITDMNKKLGRKPPPLDLGVPADSKPAPASEKPKQP